MAITMLLVCWLIWLTGCVAFLLSVRKETSVPSVKPGIAAQRQQRTHHCAEHIADVADVRIDRHGDVGKGVGSVGALAQLLIQRSELFQALLFVAEHLDNLLTVHHFLDIAVDRAQILLLAGKIDGGLAGDL